MGAACSGDGAARTKMDRMITEELREDRVKQTEDVKLLLLGAGESGKTTIFKQMKILENKDRGASDFSTEELRSWIPSIYSNLQSQMKVILNAAPKLDIAPTDAAEAAWAETVTNASATAWSPEIADAIKHLWTCTFVKEIFQKAAVEFQLNDSAKYFFNRLDDIMSPNYTPTTEDVLRCRVRTTGISEARFNFSGFSFKLLDVGGQRNERRKWIHCFDNVTAVLFCAAVSEYMQTLREDETQNRLQEAVMLFDEVVNSHWFAQTPVILFLNKVDLLKQRLMEFPLNQYFETYNGGEDFDAASTFIKNRFLEANAVPRPIYPHFTVAIDTKNVQFVFQAVRDIIIAKRIGADRNSFV